MAALDPVAPMPELGSVVVSHRREDPGALVGALVGVLVGALDSALDGAFDGAFDAAATQPTFVQQTPLKLLECCTVEAD